jgi:long-chain acyl-CoA synthetase
MEQNSDPGSHFTSTMSQEFELTDVAQVFREHEILITGVNGFLGKVLLGLILDRLPEFKHLHILLRGAANISAQERFRSQTLGSPALEGLTKSIIESRGSSFLGRNITVWTGDISQPGCGLDPAALEGLRGRVGAIINCAGLVEFFPPVDDAFASNVDGVENIVALAKQVEAKLVHISTCYVCGEADGLIEESERILGYYPHRNGPEDSSFNYQEELRYCRERIRQIYDSEGPPKSGVEFRGPLAHAPEVIPSGAQSRSSKQSAQRLAALGKQRAEHWGWVNTYTYSKSVGEQIIAAEANLDYAIVRPAIVESALRFPLPGWIEGGRTAAPLVLMALSGLKHWPVRRDIPLEVVPVDLVASAILVVTALLLDGRHEPVYQLASADVNPVDLESVVRLLHDEFRRRGSNGVQRNGSQSIATSILERLVGANSVSPRGRLRFLTGGQARTRRVRLQERVGRAQDLIVRTGKVLEKVRLPGKRRLSAWNTALRTLGLRAGFREQTLDQYLPFVLHNRYIFESENIRQAYSRVSEKDRQLLPWDPERIDWKDYWINYQITGIEKWVQPEAVKE